MNRRYAGQKQEWKGNKLECYYNIQMSESESCSVMSDSLRPRGLSSPWNSPGQNTGMSSLSLIREIFPTQGSNAGLHCRQILNQWSHLGSPRILQWVAYPFSRGSSLPRNRTGVSYIAGWFFTNWAMREAQCKWEIQSFRMEMAAHGTEKQTYW